MMPITQSRIFNMSVSSEIDRGSGCNRYSRVGSGRDRVDNPAASEKEKQALRVDLARVAHWKSQGAQVSPTVARLVKQYAGSGTADAAAAQ